MSQFYIRKKNYIQAPGPLESDNLNIFSPVTILGGYITTSLRFMLLPTQEIGDLMMSLIYIAHLRKKLLLAPRPPHS